MNKRTEEKQWLLRHKEKQLCFEMNGSSIRVGGNDEADRG